MSSTLKTRFMPSTTTSTSSPRMLTVERCPPTPFNRTSPIGHKRVPSTGKVSQDEGKGLTQSDFSDGYNFFGFDFTLDTCDGSCCHLIQKGNLGIEIHFAAALAETVNISYISQSVGLIILRPCGCVRKGMHACVC